MTAYIVIGIAVVGMLGVATPLALYLDRHDRRHR